MKQQNAEKQIVRWRLLKIIYTTRPRSIVIDLITLTISDSHLNANRTVVEKELDFLAGLGLIEKNGAKEALYEITPAGVNVVEGDLKCPAGIAKPELAE